MGGGPSVAERKKCLLNRISFIDLNRRFNSRNELYNYIYVRLTDDERNYLNDDSVKAYYDNQINYIWEGIKNNNEMCGGPSVSERQNCLLNKISSINLNRRFNSRDGLKDYIFNRLTNDERNYLSDNRVKTYYDNQINDIWEEIRNNNEMGGGLSVSERQNCLLNRIRSINLNRRFNSRDELSNYIYGRLTDDESNYLSNDRIRIYYDNQINDIWEEKCLKEIKIKIIDFNYNDTPLESKFDLELKVQRALRNLEYNFFDNIDSIQEFNRTWNNLNEQKKSLKNKIDSNIIYIISFNNVSAKENIKEQITNNFDEEERKCFNKFRNDIEIFLFNKCNFAWDQIVRRLKEKIEGINSIFLTYDYCETKDKFKEEIENNYLNYNDRKIINTITNFRIVIDKCWKNLEIIKKEKSGQKNLEMEKKFMKYGILFLMFKNVY